MYSLTIDLYLRSRIPKTRWLGNFEMMDDAKSCAYKHGAIEPWKESVNYIFAEDIGKRRLFFIEKVKHDKNFISREKISFRRDDNHLGE